MVDTKSKLFIGFVSLLTVIIAMILLLQIFGQTGGEVGNAFDSVSDAEVDAGTNAVFNEADLVNGEVVVVDSHIFSIINIVNNSVGADVLPATNYTLTHTLNGTVTFVADLGDFNNSDVNINYNVGRTNTLPLVGLFSRNGIFALLYVVGFLLLMTGIVFVVKKKMD